MARGGAGGYFGAQLALSGVVIGPSYASAVYASAVPNVFLWMDRILELALRRAAPASCRWACINGPRSSAAIKSASVAACHSGLCCFDLGMPRRRSGHFGFGPGGERANLMFSR